MLRKRKKVLEIQHIRKIKKGSRGNPRSINLIGIELSEEKTNLDAWITENRRGMVRELPQKFNFKVIDDLCADLEGRTKRKMVGGWGRLFYDYLTKRVTLSKKFQMPDGGSSAANRRSIYRIFDYCLLKKFKIKENLFKTVKQTKLFKIYT